jgi:hypothetical protein
MYFSCDASVVIVEVVRVARIGALAKCRFGIGKAGARLVRGIQVCLKAECNANCRRACMAKMDM